MKKRRIRYIVLTGFVFFIGAAAAIGYWQRNNIRAFILATTSDRQTLEEKQEDLSQKREELLSQFGVEPGKPSQEAPRPESEGPGEKDAPQSPQAPEETERPSTDVRPDDPASPSETDEETEQSNAVIRTCIVQLQTLEDSYLKELEQVMESAKREFRSLPEEEKTTANKKSIVEAKVSLLSAMEKECDAKVEEQLALIQKELDRQGRKDDLVSEIRAFYQETKATWKAMRLTELKKTL